MSIDQSPVALKKELYRLCSEFIDRRIASCRESLAALQSSANEETKSSVGDKYETGKAMLQIEIEKGSVQLAEALKMQQDLLKIDYKKISTKVELGTVVITDQFNFFIAMSAGQLSVDNKLYFAVSTSSPVGAKLIGLKVGDSISFNNRNQVVRSLF